MTKLSVIIPTHRRADILKECIRHLERQTIVQNIEVIVVDDADDMKTHDVVSGQWSVAIRLINIEPCQQGVARNEGLKYATGEYVLFIGDDIFLEPEACAKHIEAHETWSVVSGQKQSYPLPANHYPLIAVLGHTTWDPAVGITPVMIWLESSGWQFGYPTISAFSHTLLPENIQHRFTYTSHISLPLSEAKKTLFRTDVHLYGWEDIEWGMRLKHAGVRVYYEPRARALHHHHITLEESLKRMEILGRSAVEIQKKVLEFDRLPKGWKLYAYKVASLLPTIAGRHRRMFLRGVQG